MKDAAFKLQCQTLRRQGLSLNQIVKITGRPKTSVLFHIRNIPLTDKRKLEIRQKSRELMFAFRQAHPEKITHKGASWLGRHPVHFSQWTPFLVRVVAHFLFDGSIRQGTCLYYNRNATLLEQVRSGMKLIFPYEPTVYREPTGVLRLAYHNVEIGAYMREKSDELLQGVETMEIEMRRAFLRSFFDDEGCVSFMGKKKYVRGYQYNRSMLELIQRLLLGFDIESKLDKRCTEIVISRRENLIRFRNEINFSPGLRVNGNRSNSIWKQHLEKREILERAINSYQ